MINRKQIDQMKPLIALALLATGLSALAQTAPPPNLGQNTKGQPAIEETAEQAVDVTSSDSKTVIKKDIKDRKRANGPLGTATIKESRRENGQVYLIELEHSSGAKQYIEENDSDGDIQSTSDDLEETPNLPKWKIGSW